MNSISHCSNDEYKNDQLTQEEYNHKMDRLRDEVGLRFALIEEDNERRLGIASNQQTPRWALGQDLSLHLLQVQLVLSYLLLADS